ncbi:hypothetical protein Tcan_11668 [Toxocara canis]|uniref:Uncharacterized protein n=1 Tax=Toxocara canis TaxID=6265 RepID=A0A0B2VH75_TOXCA|nr:hypothetical protein Tcan_11668 [Toxocara canis]
MAPRHEGSPFRMNTLLTCIPSSWPIEAKFETRISRTQRLSMFATGLSLLVLCRIRANSSSSSSRRRPRNDATRPFSRRDPLPVWTIDAVDPTLRPPPDYYEAIHW